ncbi:hypothetical protein CSUI_001742 [Cystoisospora suis]|uniref:MmgE/PrpD family protein n=1 Tax=Cystoisospora suis TaxID=483139 RepID=A0A2C6LB98_9APIC|nr:hypothetical protein CSUI_001742 [Cystoisospora suis]
MICLDEIRGRLAEVFSLKTYRIDHVLYGAIASAAVYGALTGASAEMIESAIGMVVSHYTPWRSIRAGKQLSDSKGSSAALSTEAAILSIKRAMKGFLGPRDIFRNPDSPFRWNVKTGGDSPFDLILSHSGDDFAVSHMHFKLGLYEHQSAGAIEGILRLLMKNPEIYTSPAAREDIKEIVVKAYEPAFSIIGDPAKRDPHTRQSADHSMVYIVSTLLRKAIERREPLPNDLNEVWSHLMLTPYDYSHQSIFNELTRKLMEKTSFEHGGEEYDEKYPEGVPTSVTIEMANGRIYDSGFIMFPTGHASNAEANLEKILNEKFRLMADIAISDKEEAEEFLKKLKNMESLTNEDLQTLYYIKSLQFHEPIDQ